MQKGSKLNMKKTLKQLKKLTKKDYDLLFAKVKVARNAKFIDQMIKMVNIRPYIDKIAVAFWMTPAVYNQVKKRFPHNDVYYIDSVDLSVGIDKDHVIIVDIDNEEYWPDMKFDKVIMNPPYDSGKKGEGHLDRKILFNVIDINKDYNCDIVCLSPSSLVEDTYTILNSDDNMNYLVDHQIVTKDMMNKSFGIGISNNGCIYKFNTLKKDDYFKSSIKETNVIISKVINSKNFMSLADNSQSSTKYDNYNSNMVVIERKSFTTDASKVFVKYSNYDKELNTSDKYIVELESKTCVNNFIDSLNTTFMKYTLLGARPSRIIRLSVVPFMKDYTQPWTDERFYKYFNITKKEQEIIKKTMEEYK